MEIKQNWYYILKNSNDKTDIVKVLQIDSHHIYFEYTFDDSLHWSCKRLTLDLDKFKEAFIEHGALNVLYSS